MLTAILPYLVAVAAWQQPGVQPPRVFLLNGPLLARERQTALSNPESVSELVQAARAEADRAMRAGPFSVMEKSAVPPSGDKHDYLSLAPYFWPDPKKPGGLPYIRRDGERNPEIKQIPDHDNMGKMSSAVRALALGYYLTGDEDYAARASLLLHTWFLDPRTRMNPNLEFAQGVRGVNTGRGIGIIESQGLTSVVDAAGLLSGSKSWTSADGSALQQWFSRFLDWLRMSSHGRDESHAKNNHGTYYDVQVMDFALFVGRKDVAAELASKAAEKRITAQIEPDGRQPLELARTKSFSYSAFNLRALCELAILAQPSGVDLWHFQTRDGRSIAKALDFLLPYAAGEKKWPYQQIEPLHPDDLVTPLLQAATALNNSQYRKAGEKILPFAQRAELILLRAEAE